MRTDRLETSYIIADIQARLADLIITEDLSPALRESLDSPGRLLRAINKADIAVCARLRPYTNVVQLLPAGASDILMYNEVDALSDMSMADSKKYPDAQTCEYMYLTESIVDARQVRGSNLYLFSEYPSGNSSPFEVMDITHREKFDGGTYRSPSTATYDPYSGRLRLSTSYPEDVFISWQAYIMPQRLDMKQIEKLDTFDPDDYTVCAPHYAEEYLLTKAMTILLPSGNRYRQALLQDEFRMEREADLARPDDTSVIHLDSIY